MQIDIVYVIAYLEFYGRQLRLDLIEDVPLSLVEVIRGLGGLRV